jgi:thiol reductant ABC exporter CydC subunit
MALSTIGLAGTSAWLIVRSAERPGVLTLTLPMGLVQLFALSKAVGRYVERTKTHEAALSVMTHVRSDVARTVSRYIPAGLGPKSGDVVELVLSDVIRVQELLTSVAGPLFTSLIAGVVTVVVSGLIVPMAGVTLLGSLLLIGIVLPLFAERIGRHAEEELDTTRRDIGAIFETMAAAGDEILFGENRAVTESRLSELEDRYDDLRRGQSWRLAMLQSISVLLSGAVSIVLVLFIAKALNAGNLNRTLVAVPVLLAVSALELVGGISPILLGLRGDQLALNRLSNFGARRVPVSERGVNTIDGATTLTLTELSVGFSEPLVSSIDLTLVAGDILLIDGQSGVGKTTLAHTLVKFLDPLAGRISLDQWDTAELLSSEVRKNIGFSEDRPHIFLTSLAANIRIAKPDATEEEVRSALSHAQLDGLMASLPDGIATEIGGATAQLSGGEQRRIGLAREFLSSKAFSILDEPTEGLDESTAGQVLEEIQALSKNRAVMVISHLTRDQGIANKHLTIESVS